jgi:hypothetical protein
MSTACPTFAPGSEPKADQHFTSENNLGFVFATIVCNNDFYPNCCDPTSQRLISAAD